MHLKTSILAARPDLCGGAIWEMATSWPEFMRHDPIGSLDCDVERGTAVYIEPNVWVRHST